MASSKLRPGGMSDEDSDSEIDSFTFNFKSTGKNSKSCKQQRAGPLLPCTSTSKLGLNARQRRNVAFREAMKKIKAKNSLLPPVQDPKLFESNIEYFRYKRQTNMNLRMDPRGSNLPHINGIYEWSPEEWMISSDCLFEKERELSLTPLNIVSTQEQFEKMLIHLKSLKFFSLDLEGHMEHSFLGLTALLQIGTLDCDYLLDPFPMFSKIVDKLKPVMEDPTVLKLMHGMANDFTQLIRDFGIRLSGVLDSQCLYNVIRKDRQKNLIGLDNLAKLYIKNYKAPTKCTMEDWRRRPLTPEMQLYARNDVFSLLNVVNIMKTQCRKEDLQKAFVNTKLLMMKSFAHRQFPSALDELASLNKKADQLYPEDLTTFEYLHQWRHRYAAIVDDIPAAILSSSSLLALAQLKKPIDEENVKNVGIPFAIHCQIPTIVRVINEKTDFFNRINLSVCHNCINKGHVAIHCPFSKNPKRQKEYLNMHPDVKTQENRRRRQNRNNNNRDKKNKIKSEIGKEQTKP